MACIEDMERIAVNGKYREKLEIYRTVQAFDFFKNCEGVCCIAVEDLEEYLENKLADEDIAEINSDYKSDD